MRFKCTLTPIGWYWVTSPFHENPHLLIPILQTLKMAFSAFSWILFGRQQWKNGFSKYFIPNLRRADQTPSINAPIILLWDSLKIIHRIDGWDSIWLCNRGEGKIYQKKFPSISGNYLRDIFVLDFSSDWLYRCHFSFRIILILKG